MAPDVNLTECSRATQIKIFWDFYKELHIYLAVNLFATINTLRNLINYET